LPELRGLSDAGAPSARWGKRTLQCLDCDGPDPLKTENATGWLKGSYGRQSERACETAQALTNIRKL